MPPPPASQIAQFDVQPRFAPIDFIKQDFVVLKKIPCIYILFFLKKEI
jgi:hypothetical protein